MRNRWTVTSALLVGAIAVAIRFLPSSMIEGIAEATVPNTMPSSQTYQLVPGSVYDGDTLRVTNGAQEIKIRLCGIDAPEMEQPMGEAARDHLRWRSLAEGESLIDQGDGTLIVLPVEQDPYGRTVAEIFVPMENTEAEIHLTSQMVLDGYAYHYARYSGGCPNGQILAGAEEQARSQRLGVWTNPNAVKPWDYRQ